MKKIITILVIVTLLGLTACSFDKQTASETPTESKSSNIKSSKSEEKSATLDTKQGTFVSVDELSIRESQRSQRLKMLKGFRNLYKDNDIEIELIRLSLSGENVATLDDVYSVELYFNVYNRSSQVIEFVAEKVLIDGHEVEGAPKTNKIEPGKVGLFTFERGEIVSPFTNVTELKGGQILYKTIKGSQENSQEVSFQIDWNTPYTIDSPYHLNSSHPLYDLVKEYDNKN